jgi:hypothetical protein
MRLRPNTSASRPPERQQAAARQGVGGDHPLPGGVAEPQIVLRRREGDVHHRRVQQDHHLRDHDDQQDQPAALVVRVS